MLPRRGGFLPFAATFAVVIWIWFEHYLFFRKFGLEDGLTVVYNAVLLFVALFYVYPLKFVFSNLVPQMTSEGPELSRVGFTGMTLADARRLMSAYSAGFVAVFGVLALLYAHAWRRRQQIGLDAIGVFDAVAGMKRHAVSVGIGLLSIALALLAPGSWLWLSGMSFMLLGPAHAAYGTMNARARARLEADLQRTRGRGPSDDAAEAPPATGP